MGNSQITLSFASISGRKIEADFDGGTTTSDGGALLLRQAESKIGIVDRIVGALCDRRHQSSIDHTYIDLIKQRVFQIACGYEDANDSNDLRSDPGLKAACQRLPLTGDDLASQPTMSRLENSVSRTDLYRIALALLETFIESYDRPPKKIILDIDDTDDATHGAQQLSLFHAYHDESCSMPVHLYEGGTGKLITAILKCVLDHILMAWPQVQITLRGDSHFSAPEVHDLCDGGQIWSSSTSCTPWFGPSSATTSKVSKRLGLGSKQVIKPAGLWLDESCSSSRHGIHVAPGGLGPFSRR